MFSNLSICALTGLEDAYAGWKLFPPTLKKVLILILVCYGNMWKGYAKKGCQSNQRTRESSPTGKSEK